MKKKKILHLTLHARWFDEILSGKKKVEYRDIKPYWEKRLFENGKPKGYDLIFFRNGYSKNCRKMKVEFKGVEIREYEGKEKYAIKLGKVLWNGKDFSKD